MRRYRRCTDSHASKSRALEIMTTRKRTTPVRKIAGRPPKRRPVRSGRAAPLESTARAGTAAAGRLVLGAECTLAEADGLKRTLGRLLAEPRPVRVEVAALRRVDTAGLQLLATFVRDRRTAGRVTEWRGRAPALEAAADVLGLRGMLELPAGNGR
jgi:ABC-type transporter Mla MlaB component